MQLRSVGKSLRLGCNSRKGWVSLHAVFNPQEDLSMLLHMPVAMSQESESKTCKVSQELTQKFSQYYFLYIALVSADHNASPGSWGGKIDL